MNNGYANELMVMQTIRQITWSRSFLWFCFLYSVSQFWAPAEVFCVGLFSKWTLVSRGAPALVLTDSKRCWLLTPTHLKCGLPPSQTEPPIQSRTCTAGLWPWIPISAMTALDRFSIWFPKPVLLTQLWAGHAFMRYRSEACERGRVEHLEGKVGKAVF